MNRTPYVTMAALMLGSALVGGLLTVATLGTVTDARSYTAFPDGAFVQGRDETRWVVGSGRRFRMAFVGDEAGLLPGLPEGGVVASVCEASAAVMGTDRAVCAVSPSVAVVPPARRVAPPVVTPAAPQGLPVPEGTLLLDAYGGSTLSGPSPGPGFGPESVVTQPFVNSVARELELCWEVTDPATTTAFASFTIWERAADGDQPIGFSAQFNQSPGCLTFPGQPLPSGAYVVQVTSSFRYWRVTVRVR